MNREQFIQQLESTTEWDICIIGGGATGLGTAVDAATRGFKTILFEQYDFAKGTSSRSTKLVHGGVRYLQQGNVKLVMEALKERGMLLKNAPHLVKNQKFIVPNYQWWEGPFYGIGLKIYDWMAGSLGLGPSQFLSKEETLELAPTLEPEGLRGGVIYHDGQFDDARLAINIAETAAENNAVVLNYFPVTGLLKVNDKICGVKVKDSLSGKEYEVKSKAVINATGVFTDGILNMDNGKDHEEIIAPSQGIHLVLDKEFLPGECAIMIPHTDDGRVLFAVPWHQKVILGTTDTPVSNADAEPVAQKDEINFLVNHIGRYLTKDPKLSDVKSIFAGLRPLVKGNSKTTAALSRDHLITVSNSGLITITGGKWTTYRHMAEDVIDIAIASSGLADIECKTKNLAIHGSATVDFEDTMYYFGSDKPFIYSLADSNPDLKEKLHPALPYIKAEIVWAVRNEMCMTVEDALSRRTRALLLDAKAAIESAPVVASIMAREMKKDAQWEKDQVAQFNAVAKNYLPDINS
ncbi:MAG: glycerol-3-phosphate dehydrogenase/oxidase [Chitinophagaceae bacterium]|nr:glycerol-3-phosphate dehydrogenase/oxidase [Chitinophagaceae bacterium]